MARTTPPADHPRPPVPDAPPPPLRGDGPSNRTLADWLAEAGARTEGHLARAFRRAARAAFWWPFEARDLLAAERSLQELRGIGPYLERVLGGWILAPPEPPAPSPACSNFMTLAEAREVLRERPPAAATWGDLQVHSTWSDGRASLGTMAEAAHALGRTQLAFTDHTQGLAIAHGMDERRLRAQGDEIERAAAVWRERGLELLRSAEANLDPNGDLDMPSAVLAELDLTLGAFHSQLRRKEDQTARYVAALSNPNVDVLAHPRCRVYDRRLGLQADWRRVADEAARLGKALEIDGHPERQDLDVVTLEHVRAAGCLVSMGSDAHSPGELEALEIAVASAVLAGIPEDRWINLWNVDELRAWARARRAD